MVFQLNFNIIKFIIRAMKGEFKYTEEKRLDEKYRITLPESYRIIIHEAETKWVMVPVRDKKMSLDVMTETAFRALEDDTSEKALKILGVPHHLDIDAEGRIMLPKEFRRFFPGNKVRIVGAGDYFCIDPIY